jgi:formylglycine-generating enzyme required for sulfatase activity
MKPWSKTVHLYQLILVFCLVAAMACPVLAAKRTALVIGNSNYAASPLANPVNDATDMARALRQIGFDVIIEINADERTIKKSIDLFFTRLKQSQIGLFYFAGHGMQIGGHNYLIPVNADISTASDVEYESVDAGRVLGKMETAGNRLNIVILDACRDNPFKRSFRTGSQGLAQMDAPKGSIIAYATSPGGVAADGSGRNGIYTKYLLQNIGRPGLTIQEFFNEAGRSVMEETNDKQIPWVSSTPVPRVFLAGGMPGDQDLQPVRPQPAQPSPTIPDKAQLYVVTDPGGGEVRIMNIVEKYYDGIELDPGRYKLEGSMAGYRTKTGWITIDGPGDVDVTLTLTPETAAPAVAAPSVTPPAQTTPRTDPAASQPASAAGQTSSPRAGDVWKEPMTGMEFVWVPGGCYMMGSPLAGKTSQLNMEKKPLWYRALAVVSSILPYGCVSSSTNNRSYVDIHGYYENETPAHEVCLDGFWIGKYEVSQGQWKKIMGNNPSHFKSGDDFPVENVSWNDAKAYIQKLSRESGNRFALPTEAQWEYAARSGGKNEKYAGGSNVDSVAWYWDWDNSGRKTHRVGTKAPNGLDIYDMSGNVREWCEDVYDNNAYSKHTRSNPVVASGGSARVNRGGSWNNSPKNVRAADRGWLSPAIRGSYLGFRLAHPRID